jgi:membrane protease subunit HflC
MRTFLVVFGALAAVIVVRMSFYSVDAAEYAYITQLGRHVATFDGADTEKGGGLHVGWPWPIQKVIRLDRRLQHFDLPATELLTHDPEGKTIDKTLTVEAFVCWRIVDAEAVDRFIRRMGTPEQARTILGQRINSQLGAAIGQMRMEDLISTEPGKAPGTTRVDETMSALQDRLLDGLQAAARNEYGIELVDIRLRRFNHPALVRSAIFDRIRSERNKKVAEYQSEGQRRARNIESEAEEKVRRLLAEARFQEEKLKGEADTEAMRIRNDAHSQDPEFYAFLKTLEKLQNILGDNKTVLLLSSKRPIFDLLYQPPRPGNPGMSSENGTRQPANGNESKKAVPPARKGGAP